MLDCHVVLAQLLAFHDAVFQRFFRPRAQLYPAAVFIRCIDSFQVFLQFCDNRVITHAAADRFRNGCVGLQQRQQHMFRTDIRLLKLCGDPLREGQCLLGFLGKTSEYRH